MSIKTLLICLALSPLLVLSAWGQEIKKKAPADMASEDFLEACRKQLLGNCWIKLDGQINVKKKDGVRLRPMALKCAAQLVPNKITFKATIQKNQSFKVEHTFGDKHDTKVLENTLGENSGFDQVGLKPTDLSLAFMYWNYIKEYKKDGLGVINQYKCRVLLLGNPDGSELVKVWLSEKYLAPLQVKWYKDLKKDPLQVLNFESFEEKNKVWVPLHIKITNTKGDLQVTFKKEKIEAAFSSVVPKDLYKTEN
jgi:hypothetical protein